MKNEILKSIFWDLDAAKLDIQKHSHQIIERILDYGGQEQIQWMFKTYPKKQTVERIKNSRNLFLSRAKYWASYYNIPKKDVRCLKPSFRKIYRSIWPY